jgi:hypothetical protein
MGKDEETEIAIQGLTSEFGKQRKLNCGAERHHYSMFNVGCSMFSLFAVRPHGASYEAMDVLPLKPEH